MDLCSLDFPFTGGQPSSQSRLWLFQQMTESYDSPCHLCHVWLAYVASKQPTYIFRGSAIDWSLTYPFRASASELILNILLCLSKPELVLFGLQALSDEGSSDLRVSTISRNY